MSHDLMTDTLDRLADLPVAEQLALLSEFQQQIADHITATRTVVIPLAQYRPTQPLIYLGRTKVGGGWDGTFDTLVFDTAADMLSDGAPVNDVSVSFEHADGKKFAATGTLTEADPHTQTLTFADGYTISAATILQLGVA